MSFNDTSWRGDPPGIAFRVFLILSALIAAAVAAYLLWTSIAESGPAGCDPTSAAGCDSVLASRWSTWFGVPVTVGAVVVYVAIFAASFAIGPRSLRRHQRTAWQVLLPCAVLAGGAAVWFTTLQFRAGFCPYCLTVHVCGLIIAVLTALRLPFGSDLGGRGSEPLLSGQFTGWSSAGALAALGLLVVGQLLPAAVAGEDVVLQADPALLLDDIASDDPRKTAAVPADPFAAITVGDPLATLDGGLLDDTSTEESPEESQNASQNASRNASHNASHNESPEDLPSDEELLRRDVGLSSDRFVVDSYNEPIIGDPNAPTVIVELFDYTCSHCRKLHAKVKQIPERYGDELAVVVAPTPMNNLCNQFFKKTRKEHIYACHYARYALAIWRVDRTAFADYHAWLLDVENPPSVQEALERGKELVGGEAFVKEVRSRWITNILNRNAKIHHRSPGRTLPKLMTRDHTVTPASHDLFRFIELKMRIRRVKGEPP